MIKCDIKTMEMSVEGNHVQVTTELQMLARRIREELIAVRGKEVGMRLWERALEMAKMSDEQAEQFYDEESRKYWAADPEGAKAVEARTSAMLAELWGHSRRF